MANAVVTDYFMAQVVLKAKSGIPKDNSVNRFYFRNENVGAAAVEPDTVAGQIADHLRDFYKETHAQTAAGIRTFMAGQVLNDTVEIRVYDMGTPPGQRFPILLERNIGPLGTGTVLPEEVAACITWVAGANRPRSRGRTYIGPLANTALTVENGRTKITTGFRTSMAHAANFLQKRSHLDPTQGVRLHLWSPSDGVMKEVSGGWVDDAFDTQRRRGPEPTSRFSFGLFQGQSTVPVAT
jgi:hypothetical protein